MIRMPYQKQLKLPITFPAVLSKSRDYNAIEVLLYTIFYYFYTESVESKNLHNPQRCRAELLPMLADMYRYQYTDVDNIDLEREIMATVPELHHNKGCVTGIDNALALCKVDKTAEFRIPWFYLREDNTIIIIMSKEMKTYKMMELLKLVVPLGTKIIIKPGYFVNAKEEIKMHSWTAINAGPLQPEKQYYVQPNNFWKSEWNELEQCYTLYVDEQWALSDPTNKDPQGLGEDGATRISMSEVAGNEVDGPGGQGEDK